MDMVSRIARIRQLAAVLLSQADALEQEMRADEDERAAYDDKLEACWACGGDGCEDRESGEGCRNCNGSGKAPAPEADARHRLAVLAANGMTESPF